MNGREDLQERLQKMDKNQMNMFLENQSTVLTCAIRLKRFSTGHIIEETKRLAKEGILKKPLSRPVVIDHLEILADKDRKPPLIYRLGRKGSGWYSAVTPPEKEVPEELKNLFQNPKKCRRGGDVERSAYCDLSVGKNPYLGTYIGGGFRDMIVSHIIRFALFYYALSKDPENPDIEQFKKGEVPEEVWKETGLSNNLVLLGIVFNGPRFLEWGKTPFGKKAIRKAMKNIPKSCLEEFETLKNTVGLVESPEEALDMIYF